jgi:DNA polymerase type B, organellar and viral
MIDIELSYNNFKINFRDSYLMLPLSLRKLAITFKVDNKGLFPYSFVNNHTDLNYEGIIPDFKYFNNISLDDYNNYCNSFIDKNWSLKIETLKYCIQDCISLYQIIEKFNYFIFNLFNLNIHNYPTLPSLAFGIYRSKYLKDHKIPLITGQIFNDIRKSYTEGSTDYYKAHISNGKYYDINSLYPYAMSKLIPFEIIKYYNEMSNIKLSDFFGFALAQIHCPKNMVRPVLPYKHEGKTIYSTGCWIGIYFSEELKAVEKLGYEINLIKGYEFSKIDLFSKYIDHFYSKKKYSSGATRFIAKMHLNQLYGYFGRKLDLIETINVFNNDLILYVGSRIIKTIIQINDNISTILLHSNINPEIIKELNSKFEFKLNSKFKNVKTNVAIAAAVTSYARIHMIPFKLLTGTVYTDTDSIFTTEVLPDHLIGKDLGLMKDELDGKFILEGYFLGIKQYGYKYLDNNNQIVENSTFAGVPLII